jgi:hypothetical protein
MSRSITKGMYLEKPRRQVIWDQLGVCQLCYDNEHGYYNAVIFVGSTHRHLHGNHIQGSSWNWSWIWTHKDTNLTPTIQRRTVCAHGAMIYHHQLQQHICSPKSSHGTTSGSTRNWQPVRLAGGWWLVLVCCERRVLLAGCWWLVCCERKVLLAGGW